MLTFYGSAAALFTLYKHELLRRYFKISNQIKHDGQQMTARNIKPDNARVF